MTEQITASEQTTDIQTVTLHNEDGLDLTTWLDERGFSFMTDVIQRLGVEPEKADSVIALYRTLSKTYLGLEATDRIQLDAAGLHFERVIALSHFDEAFIHRFACTEIERHPILAIAEVQHEVLLLNRSMRFLPIEEAAKQFNELNNKYYHATYAIRTLDPHLRTEAMTQVLKLIQAGPWVIIRYENLFFPLIETVYPFINGCPPNVSAALEHDQIDVVLRSAAKMHLFNETPDLTVST